MKGSRMKADHPELQTVAYALTDFTQSEVRAFQTAIEGLLIQLRQADIRTNLEYISAYDLAFLATKPASAQKLALEQLLPMAQVLQPKELALLEAFTIYLLHGKDFKASLPEIMQRNEVQIDNPAGFTEFIVPVLVLAGPHSPDRWTSLLSGPSSSDTIGST
jgi:hypothetical protein